MYLCAHLAKTGRMNSTSTASFSLIITVLNSHNKATSLRYWTAFWTQLTSKMACVGAWNNINIKTKQKQTRWCCCSLNPNDDRKGAEVCSTKDPPVNSTAAKASSLPILVKNKNKKWTESLGHNQVRVTAFGLCYIRWLVLTVTMQQFLRNLGWVEEQ